MSELLLKTQKYVTDLLTTQLDDNYLYHNLRHTERVVNSVQELLEPQGLTGQENEAIVHAVWFHDTGYTKGPDDHEKASVEIATLFLEANGYPPEGIAKVGELIMATQRGHTPQNRMEEMMCDADTSHLHKSSYMVTSEMLREELALLGVADFSAVEWYRANIKLFQTGHRYYTDYAKKDWQEGKDGNLKGLVKKLKKQERTVGKEKLKVELKDQSPERSIQTMFRIATRNHLKLSDIADSKANILLSVNAIIISLVLSNLVPKLDNPSNKYLIYPAALFVLFSIASIILSVLATRPNISSGEFTKEDVENKKVNLLFFGNFHKMKLSDFRWGVQELIKDQTYVYDTLSKDLYYLGDVLNTKYKLLRWNYAIFIIGMVVSSVVFFVSLEYNGSRPI